MELDLSKYSVEQLEKMRVSWALKERLTLAKTNMLEYMLTLQPDPDGDDPLGSLFEATPLAKLLCSIIEKVDRGELKRVCVSVGPQFGKSQVLSRGAPSWLSGRKPRRHMILGSYNDTFAQEFGGEVRDIIQSEGHRMVFPEHLLKRGSEAKDNLVTTKGGKMAFVGVGGSGTGKPADIFFVDDPFKNDDDAQSETYRNRVWNWFNGVAFSRCHKDSAIIIVHCLTGDTNVLMANGREKKLRDIRKGDSVATYKEGKVVTSKVLNWKSQGYDCVFTIKMKSGISIRANARHPFLVYKNGEEIWQRTDLLKKGDLIRRVTGVNGKEGSALLNNVENQPNVKVNVCHTITKNGGQKELGRRLSILAHAVKRTYATVMESALTTTRRCLANRTVSARYAFSFPTRKTTRHFGMGNFSLTIATIVERLGGCSVTTAISQLGTAKQKMSYSQQLSMLEIDDDEIIDIVESGIEEVFDIQVADTENFIANSLISHNTRWHEDDLIGRLVDPDHPERNKKYKGIAERWSYYNLPAIVEDNNLAEALELKLEVPTDPFIKQQFGTKPMASLWENRKSLAFLAEAKQNDSRIFGALYMGRPSPEGGTYFKDDWLKEYDAEDLPKNLRVYAASDHAVSEKQKADYTVMGCVGIDEKDDIWVLPSLVWERMETDRTVEEMLMMMKTEKPHLWWMESELISKSFGPFLKKRMHEEKIYTTLIPEKPTKDKRTRARAIQGRMAMGKLRFPRNAHWWLSAKSQLLKFPYAANDDFVDWLSWIGLGLTSEYGAAKDDIDEDSNVIKVGSIEWLKAAANAEARKKKRELNSRGW